MFAKLTETNDTFGLPVVSISRAKPVTVGGIQHPLSIFKVWTNEDLNAIGYARFYKAMVPRDKLSVEHVDTFENGQVIRTHTLIDKPLPQDPTPTILDEEGVEVPNPDYDYTALRQRDYPTTEEMIVALWEKNMEDRPETADALEVKRQAVKAKHPKYEKVE